MSEQKKEINDVGPTSIRHFVSQKGVIDQVVVALDAAQMDGEKFPNALLVGPPGLGKSALAGIIAAEMAVEMHELLGQSVKSAADLHALLLAAKPKAIVFVDEAHELAATLQTGLYLALDKQKIVLSGGNGNHPQSIPLANFSVLLGTTDEFDLLQPLRDRMRLTLRFDYYSEQDLATVVQQRASALGWECDEYLSARKRRPWSVSSWPLTTTPRTPAKQSSTTCENSPAGSVKLTMNHLLSLG